MRYFIYALVAALVVYICIAQVRRRRLRGRCQAAFESVYGRSPSSPTFEMGYSYSFPAFTITFRSKEEREAAAAQGLNDAFKEAIAGVCADCGHPGNPFDADRAVFFTYEGHVLEMLAATREGEWGRR